MQEEGTTLNCGCETFFCPTPLFFPYSIFHPRARPPFLPILRARQIFQEGKGVWGRRGKKRGPLMSQSWRGARGNRAEKDVRCEGGPFFCLEVMGSAIFNSLFFAGGGAKYSAPAALQAMHFLRTRYVFT